MKSIPIVTGLLIIFLFQGILSCDYLNATLQKPFNSQRATPQSDTVAYIAQLQRDIDAHKKELQAAVQAAGDIAHFNKLLAIEYFKVDMFGLALESLSEALLIEPNNEILYYLSGVASVNVAKVYADDTPERATLIENAERVFLRSIELNNTYSDPLFAISVLYVFETREPQRAIDYLNVLMTLDSKNPQIYTLLGRVYAELAEYEKAEQYYEQAATYYADEQDAAQARENIQILKTFGES